MWCGFLCFSKLLEESSTPVRSSLLWKFCNFVTFVFPLDFMGGYSKAWHYGMAAFFDAFVFCLVLGSRVSPVAGRLFFENVYCIQKPTWWVRI